MFVNNITQQPTLVCALTKLHNVFKLCLKFDNTLLSI